MPRLQRAAAMIALLGVAVSAAPEETGVSGSVVAPDGTPVRSGSVVLYSRGVMASTAIEPAGRFRLVPHQPGDHEIHLQAAGYAPYRARVRVPASKVLSLPPIRLSHPTYFRVRFVSPAGEPIAAPHVLRRSLDVSGVPIWEPGARGPDPIDGDGTVMVGPLPRGVTTLAVDAPPFARTRLKDLRVTGESPLIDGGAVTLERGAELHVQVVDGSGKPVPDHEVYLEDAVPLSPLVFEPKRTDEQGGVSFERVASGRYRTRTRTVGLCGRQPLSIVRAISVAGPGPVRIRLVVGGTATIRLTSSGVPVTATTVFATPESFSPSGPPPWLRGRAGMSPFFRPIGPLGFATPCPGATDADGRVTFANFPPGSARIDVRLPGSTWVRRITFPVEPRDVEIEMPSGFMPLRVLDARSGDPVDRADITWISGGFRVEGITSATGEALLGGVTAAPGTLTIESRGYERASITLAEPPAMLHDVTMDPARPLTVECTARNESGDPVPGAVVELIPENALEITHFSPTDDEGVAAFFDAPPGALRFVAHAAGYAPAETRIPAGRAGPAALMLPRVRD